MIIKELEKIVEELNEEVWKVNENHVSLFSFGSTGMIEFIMYDNIMLWHSEEDDRIELENGLKEPLINHVKRKFNEHVDELMAIYFIENL